MLEINQVYNMNCIDGMKQIPNESIDLCVTSPPYKEKDGYSEGLMFMFLQHTYRILKKNSLLFLNFGHLSDDKFRPFKVCELAFKFGFNLNDTITWIKNHYTPLNGKKHLNNLTEFIFVLYKDGMPDLDRLSVGIPYVDKSNVKRYANGRDIKCGGNVWYIDIPTITKKSQRLHKDEFPEELPSRCIKLSNIPPGSLVLDPFMGSFTTAKVARDLGMNYIGFEKDLNEWNKGNGRLT